MSVVVGAGPIALEIDVNVSTDRVASRNHANPSLSRFLYKARGNATVALDFCFSVTKNWN